jgi:hypothetical protein
MVLPNRLRQAEACHRALVCLVLILSFLYNPYLSAHVSGSDLNVRHPFSNRATVGASELEKYSPVTGPSTQPALKSSLEWKVAAEPDCAQCVPLVLHSAPILRLPAFQGAVWFRPPPAL